MNKKNQISAEITAAQSTAVSTNINNIIDALKHVLTINLTAEDRFNMLKMGDKTLAFVQRALDYAEQNEALIPPFLDLPEAKRDYKLAADLQAVQQKLATLLRSIEDTIMVAGGEAYEGTLVFYHSVKGAARSNVAGSQVIYDDLKQRFPARRKSGTASS